MKFTLTILFILLSIGQTFAQSTEFSYQGQLQDASQPASGNFDFEFVLFASASSSFQVGPTVTRNNVGVANGIFSVMLDFGDHFPGSDRFLEIRVRPAGGGAFTTLSPRQPINSSPYSVRSLIANDAVTAGNFRGSLAGDILGPQTATSIANNAVTGAKLADGSVTVTKLGDGSVNVAKLGDGSVTNPKLADGSVNVAKLGDGSVTNPKLADGSVNVAKLGDGSVTNPKLADGSVNVAKLGDGSVTNIKLADGSVTMAKLGDGSVTNAKIVDVAASKVVGAVTNSLQLGGLPANQYVQTGDSRLSDARLPTAGSSNYIQNSAVAQAATNFNISGNGTAGGTISGSILNAANQLNLGGARILTATTSNFGSIYFGFGSGISGAANTFFGHEAGQANSASGDSNSFFGRWAGRSNSNGGDNSFFGSDAGQLSTGSQNSFFGRSAGVSTTQGLQNSFFGRSAGLLTTTGNGNTFVGANSGFGNTVGSNNTVLGSAANVGPNVSFGTAIGSGAVVTQSNTVALGRASDTVQILGNLNLAGSFTGNFTVPATGITGVLGLANGGTGSPAKSFVDLTTAQSIAGDKTFDNTLTGNRVNTVLGYSINGFNILRVASGSLFLGPGSGAINTGGGNTFLGRDAGNSNTAGINNTFVGDGANSASGNLNFATAIGADSVVSNSNTVVLGRTADTVRVPGTVSVTGGTDVEPGGGGYIVAGSTAATNVTIDDNEIMARSGGATSPLFINNDGGNVYLIAGGTGNVGIGTATPADKLDVDGDLRIGTTGTNGCLRRNDGTALAGSCSSDMRFKRNILAFPSLLSKVSQLRPVHYFWRSTEFPAKRFGDLQSYGLIAQEVEQVLPELVSIDAAGFKQIDYSKLPLVTIQAVKELKLENDALRAQNTAMQQMLRKMDARLNSVERTIKARRQSRR